MYNFNNYNNFKFETIYQFINNEMRINYDILVIDECSIVSNEDMSGILTKIECDSSHECGINMLHSCDIESVHELQRALRCCGLYGLANLFAV